MDYVIHSEGAGNDIAVTVIGGYLGAGKTSLVNHLLRESGEPIAVLVNDFGEINIDADLIAATDGDTITLANGCICCSLVEGFAVALETLTSSPTRPVRLLIEASGVADPATVTAWTHRSGLRLEGTVVLVDLEQIHDQSRNEYIGDTVEQQIRSADLLIANKVDLVDQQRRVDALEWLTDRSAAPVIQATQGQVEPALIFGLEEVRHSNVAVPGSATLATTSMATVAGYQTWSRVWAEPMDREEFDELLDSLPDSTLRVKGIVRFADRPDERVVLHRVGRRSSLAVDGVWRGGPSQLVGIEIASDS